MSNPGRFKYKSRPRFKSIPRLIIEQIASRKPLVSNNERFTALIKKYRESVVNPEDTIANFKEWASVNYQIPVEKFGDLAHNPEHIARSNRFRGLPTSTTQWKIIHDGSVPPPPGDLVTLTLLNSAFGSYTVDGSTYTAPVQVESGINHTIEFIPNSDSEFLEWSDYDDNNPRTINITEDTTLGVVAQTKHAGVYFSSTTNVTIDLPAGVPSLTLDMGISVLRDPSGDTGSAYAWAVAGMNVYTALEVPNVDDGVFLDPALSEPISKVVSYNAAAPYEYLVEGGVWTEVSSPISLPTPFELRRKVASSSIAGWTASGPYNLSGRISYLFDPTGADGNYSIAGAFMGDTNLVDCSDLILNIGSGTAQLAFQECTSLTKAPKLLAKSLSEDQYSQMFQGCTSLVQAPLISATTLAKSCFAGMFRNCTSLVQAPVLPATTLAPICYSAMFRGCTSLTTPPALPATTLAETCYNQMFMGCTSLTSAPELPATTLAASCYTNMFDSCTSLTTAPALPATTLADSCYRNMFADCTSLTTPPALPATTLVSWCYDSMFCECISLTTPPALPATTLAEACYHSMFSGCVNITEAPVLPATTLANSCYTTMFLDCASLSSVYCYAESVPDDLWLSGWLEHVETSGTFHAKPGVAYSTGDSGIPEGWTRVDDL